MIEADNATLLNVFHKLCRAMLHQVATPYGIDSSTRNQAQQAESEILRRVKNGTWEYAN